jgi:glutathione S-transferase
VITLVSLTLLVGLGSVPGVSYWVTIHISLRWSLIVITEYSAVPELDEFPNVKKWMKMLFQRPGFDRGRNVPGPHYHYELNKLSEEELNELSKVRGEWVQIGMKRDAEA